MDVNRLLKDSYAAKSDIESLKEKTAGFAKEESFHVVRMSQAEIQSQLATIAGEVQKLSGRFDENKYFLEKTLKESTAEIDLLKAQIASFERQMRETKDRVSALEGLMKEKSGASPSEQPRDVGKKSDDAPKEQQPAAGKTGSSQPAADSGAQYEEAYKAFQEKRYGEAREKFEAFLKAFPKDDRADNAYFWIAETYYQEKDFEAAILAYETHLKKYPKSQKAPTSLLKQGLSFVEIGDKKTGIVILEQLIERYPKSKEAESARQRVAQLKKTKK